MLRKHPSGFYQSTLLSEVPDLIHGFSTRHMGDMRKNRENRKKFLELLNLLQENVVTVKQIHGNNVGLDAVVVKDGAGAVFVADCVPILCVDQETKVIAAIHAGWKGTLGNISKNTIEEMEKLGAKSENILVSIGPHIGMCCYNVPEERAKMFEGDGVAAFFEGRWHIDLARANYLQLISEGVKPENIDAPPTCTSCQVSEFFSYRKDAKETFGEMMAVIGYAN